MFDFSGYRNNPFHAFSMNSGFLNAIDDTLRHHIHIMHTISYSLYGIYYHINRS